MRNLGPWLVTLVALVSLLAGPATGQVFLDPETTDVTLRLGEPTSVTIEVENPTMRSYVVAATATGNLSSDTKLEPARFGLDPGSTNETQVTITPDPDTEFREGNQRITFTLIDRTSAETFQQRVRLHLLVDVPALYLGSFENPLPAPLDGQNGVVLLELATWFFGGLAILLVLRTVFHRVVPRAVEEVQDEMAGMVRWPTFYVIVVLGLNYTWRLFPERPILDVTSSILDAVAIVVIGVLAYRATNATLYYYGRNIAGKTETKVDDVLVPVLEKVGLALIVAVVAFYTLRTVGVDLSFLVAGGLVAGLVISMAAQDTLSNLFSGVHLLVDRPFREGDEIELETGEICRVEEIGLRSTKLYHFANHQEIIAPNNQLATKSVINMSYPDRNYRLIIDVGVAYDTDLEKACKILYDLAMSTEEVLKGRTTGPSVYVKDFGESGIQLQLRAFVPDSRKRNSAGTKLRQAIKRTFEEEGVEIPFPQRVVHLRET